MRHTNKSILLLIVAILLHACGSIETTTTVEPSSAFGALEVRALNHATLNIAWTNPALTEPFDININIKSSEQVKNIVIASTQMAEIQYNLAKPETAYEVTISTTLPGDSSIEAVASITTPALQSGSYSELDIDPFTSSSCQILTCQLSWAWSHPTKPTSYVQSLLLQRKQVGDIYWQSVAEINPEMTTSTDQSLQLTHDKNYQYRMSVAQMDGTSTLVYSADLYTLSHDLPFDLIASVNTNVISTRFSMASIVNMVQPAPFEYTMDITLNKTYSIEQLIDKIGPIQIRPLVHITNYDSQESTYLLSNSNTGALAGPSLGKLIANDLRGKPQTYSPEQTYSFSSELILDQTLFADNLDPNDWSDYDIYISFEIIPTNSAFTPLRFWDFDFDQGSIAASTTSRIKCNSYYCYTSTL